MMFFTQQKKRLPLFRMSVIIPICGHLSDKVPSALGNKWLLLFVDEFFFGGFHEKNKVNSYYNGDCYGA